MEYAMTQGDLVVLKGIKRLREVSCVVVPSPIGDRAREGQNLMCVEMGEMLHSGAGVWMVLLGETSTQEPTCEE
jgi:hypothetical protein